MRTKIADMSTKRQGRSESSSGASWHTFDDDGVYHFGDSDSYSDNYVPITIEIPCKYRIEVGKYPPLTPEQLTQRPSTATRGKKKSRK